MKKIFAIVFVVLFISTALFGIVRRGREDVSDSCFNSVFSILPAEWYFCERQYAFWQGQAITSQTMQSFGFYFGGGFFSKEPSWWPFSSRFIDFKWTASCNPSGVVIFRINKKVPSRRISEKLGSFSLDGLTIIYTVRRGDFKSMLSDLLEKGLYPVPYEHVY